MQQLKLSSHVTQPAADVESTTAAAKLKTKHLHHVSAAALTLALLQSEPDLLRHAEAPSAVATMFHYTTRQNVQHHRSSLLLAALQWQQQQVNCWQGSPACALRWSACHNTPGSPMPSQDMQKETQRHQAPMHGAVQSEYLLSMAIAQECLPHRNMA